MTSPIEECNKYWKNHQLSLLFSGIHPKIIDFFKHLEVINIEEKDCEPRPLEVFNFDFSLLLTFQHTQTKELYYIWRNEYETRSPYGFLFEGRKVNLSYLLKKHLLTENYIDDSDFFINESDIQEFFSHIDFDPFLQKQKQYIFEKNLKKEKDVLVGLTCETIFLDEKDEMYYIVLSNGTKIPYKKETEHKTNKTAGFGLFFETIPLTDSQ